ncbi:MAG TPA: hypothetical protein VFW44_21295 [Bryobacteraceae bacterium]|nr:hypothetical protein [Bryobacteraceae bacterium]
MSLRFCTLAILTAGFVTAATPAGKDAKSWNAPRTPDGHPDLQGYWTNGSYVPLERPKDLGTKEFYTESEALAIQKKNFAAEHTQSAGDIHYDNSIWQGERFSKDAPELRTSVVFDPPDGHLPSLSDEGQKRAAERTARAREISPASPLSRSLGERCITWGADGPPMLGTTYNANIQIVQSHDSLVFLTEMMHDARSVWMDGRPHIPAGIHQLTGDSRGHWEGDTLVVDSTNFNDETNFRGPPASARQDIYSSPKLHVTERFTRVNEDTIVYRFTVEDPGTWTRPWSGEMFLRKTKGPIFEYACHEGNYGLADILAAAAKKSAK